MDLAEILVHWPKRMRPRIFYSKSALNMQYSKNKRILFNVMLIDRLLFTYKKKTKEIKLTIRFFEYKLIDTTITCFNNTIFNYISHRKNT